MSFVSRDTNGDISGWAKHQNTQQSEALPLDDEEVVDFFINNDKRKTPAPALKDPLVRLLVTKGILTAQEINDAFGWSPAPPRPPRP